MQKKTGEDVAPKEEHKSDSEVLQKRRAAREKTLQYRPRKAARNVLTRMRGEIPGPMSILQEAVFGKFRVRVWTRSAVHVRGICTGFLVMFDKHWNLALRDVDEVYHRPYKKASEYTSVSDLLSPNPCEISQKDEPATCPPQEQQTGGVVNKDAEPQLTHSSTAEDAEPQLTRSSTAEDVVGMQVDGTGDKRRSRKSSRNTKPRPRRSTHMKLSTQSGSEEEGDSTKESRGIRKDVSSHIKHTVGEHGDSDDGNNNKPDTSVEGLEDQQDMSTDNLESEEDVTDKNNDVTDEPVLHLSQEKRQQHSTDDIYFDPNEEELDYEENDSLDEDEEADCEEYEDSDTTDEDDVQDVDTLMAKLESLQDELKQIDIEERKHKERRKSAEHRRRSSSIKDRLGYRTSHSARERQYRKYDSGSDEERTSPKDRQQKLRKSSGESKDQGLVSRPSGCVDLREFLRRKKVEVTSDEKKSSKGTEDKDSISIVDKCPDIGQDKFSDSKMGKTGHGSHSWKHAKNVLATHRTGSHSGDDSDPGTGRSQRYKGREDYRSKSGTGHRDRKVYDADSGSDTGRRDRDRKRVERDSDPGSDTGRRGRDRKRVDGDSDHGSDTGRRVRDRKRVDRDSDPGSDTGRRDRDRKRVDRDSDHGSDTGRRGRDWKRVDRDSDPGSDTDRRVRDRKRVDRDSDHGSDTGRRDRYRKRVDGDSDHGSDTGRRDRYRKRVDGDSDHGSDTGRRGRDRKRVDRDSDHGSDTGRRVRDWKRVDRDSDHGSDTGRRGRDRKRVDRDSDHGSDTGMRDGDRKKIYRDKRDRRREDIHQEDKEKSRYEKFEELRRNYYKRRGHKSPPLSSRTKDRILQCRNETESKEKSVCESIPQERTLDLQEKSYKHNQSDNSESEMNQERLCHRHKDKGNRTSKAASSSQQGCDSRQSSKLVVKGGHSQEEEISDSHCDIYSAPMDRHPKCHRRSTRHSESGSRLVQGAKWNKWKETHKGNEQVSSEASRCVVKGMPPEEVERNDKSVVLRRETINGRRQLICKRHVGQLFIRGDNVVMVALAD